MGIYQASSMVRKKLINPMSMKKTEETTLALVKHNGFCSWHGLRAYMNTNGKGGPSCAGRFSRYICRLFLNFLNFSQFSEFS